MMLALMGDLLTAANLIVVVVAALVSSLLTLGALVQRLRNMEMDIASIRSVQAAEARAIAATYERRDVLAEVLKGFARELEGINRTLARLESRQ